LENQNDSYARGFFALDLTHRYFPNIVVEHPYQLVFAAIFGPGDITKIRKTVASHPPTDARDMGGVE
jgi:hypothetical protein